MNDKIIDWLMEGDPSIQWQTMRDIKGDDFLFYFKVQRSMQNKGWAAQLLSHQDESGMWGGGLYSPKWISTHYTMLFLKRLGLLPNKQTTMASKLLFERGYQGDGGISFSKKKESETCITGMVLGIVSHNVLQDERLENVIDYLIAEQHEDGGWNCRKDEHSSFNTTLSVLEGLLTYRETFTDNKRLTDIRTMQKPAHEFLLNHKLYQSHRTGEIAHKEFTKLAFPPRWRYNLLSALDYFQNINYRFDERMLDAMNLLNSKQLKNGTWKRQRTFYSGKSYFELEPSNQPSRWVTMKALRINKWWDAKSKGKL
ncbi:MAG: hypothetical protein INQ03_11710 [Candidatus Heimdallarchaeota archaeon]|nr:hypothetical protein [Candidatus Heimdallarchaeota archaeon]